LFAPTGIVQSLRYESTMNLLGYGYPARAKRAAIILIHAACGIGSSWIGSRFFGE
jgi:hypothetical protein